MHVLDTAMAVTCAEREDTIKLLNMLGFTLQEGQVLSSTLPALADALLKKGYSRREVANKLIDIISCFEVEDATLYIYAAIIFAQSDFDLADCATLAYCFTNHVAPSFGSQKLQEAYEDKTLRINFSSFEEEEE